MKSLDDLLAQSMALQAVKKKQAKKQELTSEGKEILAHADKLRDNAQWETIGNVSHIHETLCTKCYYVTSSFEGYFKLLQSRQTPSLRQIVKIDYSDKEAVLDFKHRSQSQIKFCASCAELTARKVALLPEEYTTLFQPIEGLQNGKTEKNQPLCIEELETATDFSSED